MKTTLLLLKRFRTLPIVCLALVMALATGCRTTPTAYSQSDGRCFLRGKMTIEPVKRDSFRHALLGMADPGDHTPISNPHPTWTSYVSIRTVDDGPLLATKPNQLPKQIWLEPGHHKLSTFSKVEYKWHKEFFSTDVELDIRPGYRYFLRAFPAKATGQAEPQVIIEEEPAK